MQTAWRERSPEARIKAAKEAIALNPECATGYILLADEEAKDILEAESKFREAYRIAETNHRRSQQMQHQNSMMESQHRRDTNVMIYIRRRLAMCARKLGRLKEVIEKKDGCNNANFSLGFQISSLVRDNLYKQRTTKYLDSTLKTSPKSRSHTRRQLKTKFIKLILLLSKFHESLIKMTFLSD